MNECYTCKYRRDIPGDAHSSCAKFDVAEAYYVLRNRLSPQFAEHGINNGWAFWPMNFDPVWLEKCNFYEKTED